MTRRALLVAWVAVALAFVVLLASELAQWQALSSRKMRASGERRRLSEEIQLREEQMDAELRAWAPLLAELRSTSGAADPGTFLIRLAELAGDKRVKVLAVGPLESQATPHWQKSWHAIQVVAPYREMRELVARIEAERGVLEDMRIEPAPARQAPAGRPGAPPVDEVHARFRMTALDLSAPSKRLVERALGAGSGVPPSASLTPAPLARNPFTFGAARPPASAAPAPPAPRVRSPLAPLDLSATVGFPGAHLAIENNQVVRTGDAVSGHEIVAITDTSVSLREPDAPTRTPQLSELGGAPPAGPRR